MDNVIVAPPPLPKKPVRVTQSMSSTAPRLMVHYMCPECETHVALDAYSGPPVCHGGGIPGNQHSKWMVAVEVVKEKPLEPLADIMEMSGGWAKNGHEK